MTRISGENQLWQGPDRHPRLWTVVLVEDNPHDVALVRLSLKDAGVNCVLRVLADGDEAIAFIENLDRDFSQPAIDLLLLDLNLPRRGGEEVMARLRSMKRIAQTPVMVITGSNSPRVRETAQKNAAVGCFQKPADFAEYMRLATCVRDFFKQGAGS